MAEKTGLGHLMQQVVGSWWGAMGGLTTIVGLLLPVLGVTDAVTTSLGVAIAGLFAVVGSLIHRNAQLEKKLNPMFTLACGPNIDGSVSGPCSVFENQISEYDPDNAFTFFRIAVSASCFDRIKDCRGILTKITKDGKVVWGGETEPLTFAPGGQAESLSKLIHKSPEFLDVLCISASGTAHPATPQLRWRHSDPFPELGDYYLSVTIIGKKVRQSIATLFFRWTGSSETSVLLLASHD